MIKNVHIVVMGKTGAGKSTLINTICEERLAGTDGTHENRIYQKTKKMNNDYINLIMYDTVGFELDSQKNYETITKIKERIKKTDQAIQIDDNSNINMIWYCLNPNQNRFEDFEEKLIKDLIYNYEIPFIIVLTQSWTKTTANDIKKKIEGIFSHLTPPIIRILAEDYETDIGTIEAYGTDELLYTSIYDYNRHKINALEMKLTEVQSGIDKKISINNTKLNSKIVKAKNTIYKKSKVAFRIGCIPGVSLLALQTQYISMIKEINNIFSIKLDEDAIMGICAVCITSAICSIIFAIPGLSGYLARELIEEQGFEYLDSLITAIKNSNESELSNSKIMSEKLKKEIEKRKRG